MGSSLKPGQNRKFTCPGCGQTKISRMFNKNAATKTGYQSWCRECHNEATAASKRKALKNPINRDKIDEFMSFVVQGPTCLEWTGEMGRATFQDGQQRPAARWAAEYHLGPPPIDEKGRTYEAHHTCSGDPARCVDPSHLVWVSKWQHAQMHKYTRQSS